MRNGYIKGFLLDLLIDLFNLAVFLFFLDLFSFGVRFYSVVNLIDLPKEIAYIFFLAFIKGYYLYFIRIGGVRIRHIVSDSINSKDFPPLCF